MPGRRNSLLLASGAMLLALAWQALVVHYNYGGNWTGLFYTGDYRPVPSELRAGTYVFADSRGYDGQYYRYLAHDPLLRRGFLSYFDDARLRGMRILIPGLAYLLAGGRPEWIDAAYIGLIALSLFLGVYWSSRYVEAEDGHFAWGLLFLLTPGALSSIDRMVLDGPLTTLFAGWLAYTRRKSDVKTWLVLALALLTRETGVLLLGGTCGSALLGKRRRRVAAFAAAGLPALAWYGYVAARTDPSWGAQMLVFPGVGLIRRFFVVRHFSNPLHAAVLPVIDLIALAGIVACFVLAVRWIRRNWSGPVAITIALFVLLGLVAGDADHLRDGYGWSRPLSPLVLFVLLQAAVRRQWMALAPPLMVSSSVAVYFVQPALRILKSATGLRLLRL